MMFFASTSSQRTFIYDTKISDSALWNQCSYCLFDKKYSSKEINDCLNYILETNDIFRMYPIEDNGNLKFYFKEYVPINFEVLHFNSFNDLYIFAEEISSQPIDLKNGLSVTYIIFVGTTSGILCYGHHVMCDGYHVNILYKKISDRLDGKELKIYSYKDHLLKEEIYRNSDKFKTDMDFWNNKLSSHPDRFIFSDGSSSGDFSAKNIVYDFPEDLSQKIYDFCEEQDISEAAFLYAALCIYVHRVKNFDNFTFGVPVLNRSSVQDFNTLGLFMHIVPLVINVTPTTFSQLVQTVENELFDLFRHQKFTAYDISQHCLNGAYKNQKLYDLAVDYSVREEMNGYEANYIFNNLLSLPLELHFLRKKQGGLSLTLRYRPELICENEFKDLLASLNCIIHNAISSPNGNIKAFQIYPQEQIDKVLKFSHGPVVLLQKNRIVFDLFTGQAKKTPEKTAVIATDRTLTYGALEKESNRVANALIQKGLRTGDIAAFILPRDSRLLVSMLGILKAGGAYLPIDPAIPQDRIDFMLSDSGAKFCITGDNYSDFLSEDTSAPSVKISADALCYCIYTSGSTGTPKGTLISHKNVLNYVSDNEYNVLHNIITEDCHTVLSVTTVGFDIFVTESLLPLANGKTVILASDRQASSQSALNELLRAYPANVIQTTPTKMRILTADPDQRDYLKTLKVILLGGEALDKNLVEKLRALTNAKIYNVYGPAETTVWVSAAKITDTEAISIGTPMANTGIYILDKYLKPVPVGVTGQICIDGANVGQGYLNRPELTAEKFIDNPLGEGKLYLTGDLGYWREDGNIIFIGRNDFQVKINGQRVELGEIENALTSVEDISQVAVVVRKDKSERLLICAFYTGIPMEQRYLRSVIGKKVPRYMVPHIFTHLDIMPLTTSGKIDRNALPEVALDATVSDKEYIAPGTEEERILISAVETVLKLQNVGMLDNFFDLGGDSLKSIELIALLEKQGYTLPTRDIFSAADMAALAEKLVPVTNEEEETFDFTGDLPLSSSQQAIYTAQMLTNNSTAYNIPYIIKVKSLDKARLQTALDRLLTRHESLRTRFEGKDGKLIQIIEENISCPVEEIQGEITDFIRPFDLNKAPLLRVGYRENTLVFDIHHIIADGSSMPIFFRELNEYYMDREPEGTPLQYKYFAVKERKNEEDETYWLNLFSDEVPSPELPTDIKRNAVRTYDGKTLYRLLPEGLNKKITEKCKALGITPFVYYFSAFNVLLSKFTGNEDVVIGAPVSGRKTKNLNTIGMFVNTLPQRNKPEGNKTVEQFLREVRDQSVEANLHGNISYAALAAKLGLFSPGRNPLFDVMFTYQTEEMTEIVFGDEKAEILPTPLNTSKYDFDFTLFPRKDGAVLSGTFNIALYRESTIEKLISAFERILYAALDTDTLLKDIDILSEEEKQHILFDFNDTKADFPKDKTVFDLFTGQATKTPDKICITSDNAKVSFAEFEKNAEKIDSFVRSHTNGNKQAIGIITDRSYEELAAIYGIVRGGNAYMPISPNFPEERIKYILGSSGCTLVLAQEKYISLTEKAFSIEKILSEKATVTIPSPAALPEDTLYVIFTSGSTGIPKGAKVSNRSAVNRIHWMAKRYFNENTVVMLKTPYTFDVSVWEIFGFAMYGFSLHILPPEDHYRQNAVLDHIVKGKVTDIHFVPTVFETFVNYLEKNSGKSEQLSTLKNIFLSGEALSAALVNRFRKLDPKGKIRLHNLYGPAECAVDVTYYDCDITEADPVPIGKPIDNTGIYILDKYLNPVPVGVTGELAIAGTNVGQGYLNRPELTAEKFVDNPFGTGKMYLTGDLAYWREDGKIMFVGRNDFQVKINGQRIELSEIELSITAISAIDSAVVLVKRNPDRLIAFYTGTETDSSTLKTELRRRLPSYMVPSVFVNLEKMPLNSSGKTDRMQLDKMILPSTTNNITLSPQNKTEAEICNLFSKILGMQNVGRDSNFFDLGGTSLNLISLLSEAPLSDLSPSDFMLSPTPEELAKLVEGQAGKKEFTFLHPLYVPDNAEKALVLFSFGGGDASAYTALTGEFRKRGERVALYYVPWMNQADYAPTGVEIRKLAQKQKIYFYSHCAGAVIALKLLDMLNHSEMVVQSYIAGGNIPPAKKKRAINIWHALSDRQIQSVLKKAGLPAEKMSADQLSELTVHFRKNTDEFYTYIHSHKHKTLCNLTVILSKNDIFTKNYKHAQALWGQYVTNINSIEFIDSDTHYFQSKKADKLTAMLLNILKN